MKPLYAVKALQCVQPNFNTWSKRTHTQKSSIKNKSHLKKSIVSWKFISYLPDLAQSKQILISSWKMTFMKLFQIFDRNYIQCENSWSLKTHWQTSDIIKINTNVTCLNPWNISEHGRKVLLFSYSNALFFLFIKKSELGGRNWRKKKKKKKKKKRT